MRRWSLGCLAVCAAACALPALPPSLVPVDVAVPGGKTYEMERTVEGVGPVKERVTSREPHAVLAGACAGTVELAIPGAPGGAQYYTAHLGCPDGAKVRAVRKDPVLRRTWLYQPTLEQMMRARGMVLAERGDGVRWFVPDAVYESQSWTAVVHVRGHAHEERTDGSFARVDRQLVVSLGIHSGFPAPGAHWDDVHLALLDPQGNLMGRLMMDPSDVGTHAGIQILHDAAGKAYALAFVGLMRDAAGRWRFVDMQLPVHSVPAQAAKGVAAAFDLLASTRKTQVLTADTNAPMGHLWVDGVEWLGVDSFTGVLEHTAHRPAAVLGGGFNINASPEQVPMWLLASADQGNVRMSQDRTLMGDVDGMLLHLPRPVRMGWSHVQESFLPDGTRQTTAESLRLVQAPYTQRTLRFPLPTGEAIRITQELVGITLDDGTHEYGLRQTAVLDR